MRNKLQTILFFLCCLPFMAQADETVTYLHHDVLGSVIGTSDNAGKLQKTEYLSYGTKNGIASTESSELGYTGKPHFKDLGLSYYGSRWYDPDAGRFTGIDPVAWTKQYAVHSFNRYSYANNNPYKFVDPDGEYTSMTVSSEGVPSSPVDLPGPPQEKRQIGMFNNIDPLRELTGMGPQGKAVGAGISLIGAAGGLIIRTSGVLKAAGSGPAKGFLEVSSNFKSSKAVQNLTNSKPIDFIFDPKSQRFIMGKNSLGHDGIRMAGSIGHKDIVGGSIWRQNGKLMTDQSSGHYGNNWTASIRTQYTKFMNQNGVEVSHSATYRK